MCGIIAVLPKNKHTGITSQLAEVFTDGLVIDSLRGVDGTGVVSVNKWGNVKWGKVGDHPFKMVQSAGYQALIKDAIRDGVILFGHNRKATVGGIDNDTAHPFVKDHIIVVHNGNVSNHHEIGKFDVDSEALAHVLAEEDNPILALNKVRGAFATMWYNAKSKKFYVCRNNDRPLSYIEMPNYTLLISEAWMGYGLAGRMSMSKVEPKIHGVAHDMIYEFDIETWKVKELGPVTWKPYTSSTTTTGNTVVDTTAFGWCGEGNDCGDDEIQVPTEPAAQPTGSTSIITNELVETSRKFYTGSEHEFVPTGTTATVEGGESVLYVTGEMLVGKVMAKMKLQNHARKDELMKKAAIRCKVKQQYIREGTITCLVEESFAIGKYKTYTGQEFTSKEWMLVCKESSCDRCKGKISAKDFKMTSVNNHGRKNQRVVCRKCILKQFEGMSETAQGNIIDRLGFDPRTHA